MINSCCVGSDIIATGCGDKVVRIFYLATNNDKELKKFCGEFIIKIN